MSQHPRPLRRHRVRPLGMAAAELFLSFLSCILLSFVARPAMAAWSHGNWTEVFSSTTDIHDFAVSSDGVEGTLVFYLDRGTDPLWARVSRLSRTGTRMWGDTGTPVPLTWNAEYQSRPLAVSSDGNGGAYCALADIYSSVNVLRLVHYDPSGTVTWSVNVADLGPNVGTAGVRLVPEAGVGITVGYAPSSHSHLIATRYDTDGGLVWSTDVNSFYEDKVWRCEFDMRSDGQGGVLLAWYRYDRDEYLNYGTFSEEIGAQRVDGNGSALWGADGHMVWQQPGFWHVNAYHAQIVDDTNGGAYVVTSGGERAYGQHLDAAGNETWAANGIVLQMAGPSGWDVDTDPRICRDGAGGMYVVQSDVDIYVQRVNVDGTFPWGSAGITAATPGGSNESFDGARIDVDGFGGGIVAFHDWNMGDESLAGLRFDGFSNVLWLDTHLFDATGNDEIDDIHVVGDRKGGAHFVWRRHLTDTPTRDDIYALGVNPQGQPPRPLLFGCSPDAAQPAEVPYVLVFGDYLDSSYQFSLRRNEDSIPLGGLGVFNSGLVGGWFDLSGASIGAWDLHASLDGSDRAELANAFGVGMPPSCDTVESITDGNGIDIVGSPRRMAFDPEGNCRFALLFYNQNVNVSSFERHVRGPGGISSRQLEVLTNTAASQLTYTVDTGGNDLMACIVNAASGDYLRCRGFDADGSLLPWASYSFSFSSPVLSWPVITALDDGGFLAVVEDGNPGATHLRSVYLTESSAICLDPPSGDNAHHPDLAAIDDGAAMVFVRNSWIPGVSDLCLQYFRNGSWDVPQVITFGLFLDSPTVAYDGNGDLLVAWVLDNSTNRTAPVLQTCLVSAGVPGPIRTRPTNGSIEQVIVDAQGPGNFYLMSTISGDPDQFYLRGGNGRVFYPRRRLNPDGVELNLAPVLAAQHGGPRLGTFWLHTAQGTNYGWVDGWFCDEGVTTAAPSVAPGLQLSSVKACPNPFNPRTTLAFSLSQDQWVQLDIIDLHGRRVRTLLNGPLSRGDQEVRFDGRDDRGVPLASGTYFARLRPAHDAPAAAKLTLLK